MKKREISEASMATIENIKARWGHKVKTISYHIETSDCDYYNEIFVSKDATDEEIDELVKKTAIKFFKLKWKVVE